MDIVGALSLFARFLVGTVFLLAGLWKVPRQQELEGAVASYRIIPIRYSHSIARWLPWVEICAATLLLCGVVPTAAAIFLAACLVSFCVVIVIDLARGNTFDCGCGVSVGPSTISWQLVVTDLGLAAAAALAAFAHPTSLTVLDVPFGARGTASAGEGLSMVVTATVAVLLTAMLRDGLALRKVLQ
jgi:putative oxidoreductase